MRALQGQIANAAPLNPLRSGARFSIAAMPFSALAFDSQPWLAATISPLGLSDEIARCRRDPSDLELGRHRLSGLSEGLQASPYPRYSEPTAFIANVS